MYYINLCIKPCNIREAKIIIGSIIRTKVIILQIVLSPKNGQFYNTV